LKNIWFGCIVLAGRFSDFVYSSEEIMRKFTAFSVIVCGFCVLLSACSDLGSANKSDSAVISLEIPSALFSETSAGTTNYTVNAVMYDADTNESIESLSETVSSGNSATFTFSPVEAGRAVILSINVYESDGVTLYMWGTSARYVVVEGDQSVDITLTTASGGTTTGTGTITGTAEFADGKTSNEGIVVFIEKTDTASAASNVSAVTNIAAVRKIAARSAATGTTSNYVINDAVAIAKTDSTGAFTFNNLASGSYAVYAVSDTSVEKAAYDTVTISDGGSSSVTLTLTATGNISGTVQINRKTTGNSGIFVYVPNSNYIAVTDDSGNFTIYNIPVSSTSYILTAQYGCTVRTFTADSSDTMVTAGGTAAAGIMNFATTTGIISGTVLLNGKTTGNSGIFVSIEGTTYIAQTDDSGNFTMTDVPADSTAYTLSVSYNGTVRTFAAGSDSSTPVTVTAGNTVAAGTMTFATAEEKHYFTDSAGTVSTKNYVQATKNGLKFILSDVPDNTVAFGLGFSGYTDAAGTDHDFYGDFYVDKVDYGKSVDEQNDITTLAYIYKLVSPDVTYKNVYVVLFNSTWTQLEKYSAENVFSIGGYGSIRVSNTDELSLNWDPSTFTLSMSGVPKLDLDNYKGDTIASYYCEVQIGASDGTTDTFHEESYNKMSIVLGDRLSASMLNKICGKSDVKMSVTYKVKLKEDMSDLRENSSNYNIYGITLSDQTVNAFNPTVTLDANGGTFTPTAGGTAVSTVTLSKDSEETAFTPETTFAYVRAALDAAYTLSYTAGGISAQYNPYCTDSSGNAIPVGDTTKTLGYTNYKVVFHWTLPLTPDNYGTGWSGTYTTEDLTNTVRLSTDLLAAYTSGSSAVLTVTATGSPCVYYEYDGAKCYFPSNSSSADTYTYTIYNILYPIYISGSNSTITSVVLAAQ
jgi:hypothetical protein